MVYGSRLDPNTCVDCESGSRFLSALLHTGGIAINKEMAALFMVALMLVVPLTVAVGTTDGYSVTDESSILSGNGNQSSFFDSETDSESGSADDPVITSGLDYFYDDGMGMWWTFRIVGDGEAAITGGYCTNNNMTSLNIPESVIDNASFRSDATITVKDHPYISEYKTADHILLKLQVRLDNNLYDSSFKIKIDKEGSSEVVVPSNELVTAGPNIKAYSISTGKIIIKDVTAVKLADVYYCDKDDSPIIVREGKNKYTLGPEEASINVHIPKSLVSKSNDESYSVVSIADNAFKTLKGQSSFRMRRICPSTISRKQGSNLFVIMHSRIQTFRVLLFRTESNGVCFHSRVAAS